MGVDIDDLANRSRFISASWWRWRPTVELIRSLNLFVDERLDLLSDGCGEFTQAEAHRIAAEFETQVLPKLSTGHRVLLDGTVTNEPDDYVFHREPKEQARNYGADYEWLRQFTTFCRESGGLYIC